MEVIEVDFSIFSYFWNISMFQKSSKKGRDENQASICGKQMHASNK